jgi:hypothetical protein
LEARVEAEEEDNTPESIHRQAIDETVDGLIASLRKHGIADKYDPKAWTAGGPPT